MRLGNHTFVPISWMCKKQTAVSHSSTESEIISFDTGLRLDGLPALELWDLIVSVFGSVSCALSEVTRLCQSVECARNKLLFLTAQQKLKLSLRALEKFVGQNTTKHVETDYNYAHQSRSDQY